jgi:DNA replication protein DnaC
MNKEFYLEMGGLTAPITDNFQNFNPNLHVKEKDRKITNSAKEVTLNWCNELDISTPFLCLFGSYGVGKSHLLKASADFLAEILSSRGIGKFRYMDNYEFQKAMFNFDKPKDSEEFNNREMLKELCEVQYLIFDEVGFWHKSKTTKPYLNQKIDEILCHRANKRMRTLIAGNVRPNSSLFTHTFKSRMNDETLVQKVNLWGISDFRKLKINNSYED